MRRILSLTPLWFALACDGSPLERTCTSIGYHSVVVFVRDAETGEFLTDSATIIQRGSDFVDSTTHTVPPGTALHYPLWVESAIERPGTYAVSIRRPGYGLWQAFDVQVRMRDWCHVRTVVLEANLTPLP